MAGRRAPTARPGSFRSARLEFRPTRPEDAELLTETYSDPLAARYLPRGLLGAPGRVVVTRILQSTAQRRARHFTVFTHGDGRFVGHIGLTWIDFMNRQGEIGDAIIRSEWGKGYGVEAAERMCRWAFRSLRLHRLVAHVADGNAPTIAILRQLGFREEGRSRAQSRTVGSGRRWVDILDFGLLASEFSSRPVRASRKVSVSRPAGSGQTQSLRRSSSKKARRKTKAGRR